MKKQYMIVEHRNSEAFNALKTENARLRADLADLKRKIFSLEQRFGDEVYMNCELVDLLKANGIKFRDALDHRVRNKLT